MLKVMKKIEVISLNLEIIMQDLSLKNVKIVNKVPHIDARFKLLR